MPISSFGCIKSKCDDYIVWMRLLTIFLFINHLSFSQADSISPQWNNCTIDTLFTASGTLSEIIIEQKEWSRSKNQVVTQFWKRCYSEGDILTLDYTGTKFYKGDGYIQYNGTRKSFNSMGRRISTKHVQFKTSSQN